MLDDVREDGSYHVCALPLDSLVEEVQQLSRVPAGRVDDDDVNAGVHHGLEVRGADRRVGRAQTRSQVNLDRDVVGANRLRPLLVLPLLSVTRVRVSDVHPLLLLRVFRLLSSGAYQVLEPRAFGACVRLEGLELDVVPRQEVADIPVRDRGRQLALLLVLLVLRNAGLVLLIVVSRHVVHPKALGLEVHVVEPKVLVVQHLLRQFAAQEVEGGGLRRARTVVRPAELLTLEDVQQPLVVQLRRRVVPGGVRLPKDVVVGERAGNKVLLDRGQPVSSDIVDRRIGNGADGAQN